MIWAIAIIAIVGYAGAVTVALLRALKRARKLDSYKTALALEKVARRREREAIMIQVESYKREIKKLNELLEGINNRRFNSNSVSENTDK